MVVHRRFEQAKTVLQAQYATNGIVDATHRYFAFFYQLFEQDAVVPVVGLHSHVDAGIDGHFDGLFFVGRHLLAGIEVVDVGPVGNNHTVPAEVFLEPLGQQLVAGVHGHAVDRARIDHDGEGAGFNGLQEGGKVLFTQVLRADDGGGPVFAGHRYAVAHVVLHRYGNFFFANFVGIFSLKAKYRFTAHFGIYIGVFAVAFPHAGPAWIAAQINGGVVGPWYTAGLRLVGRDAGGLAHQVAVKGCSHIDGLGKNGAAQGVGGAVALVETVYAGNTDFVHGFLLNHGDDFLPLLFGFGYGAGCIEDGADLVLSDNGVQQGLAEGKGVGAAGRGIPHYVDYQFGHLTDFFFEGHLFKQGFYLLLNFGIGRNDRICFGRSSAGSQQQGCCA